MRVAFCHPDLGLGGAERLVVDAALELKRNGHQVEIFTAFHDPDRCFVETINGQLPPPRVHGNWIPRHVFQKGHAFFATLRCLCVAWAIAREHFHQSTPSFDAVFVDQVSNVLPLLRIFARKAKLLFYCHFPDMLLAKPGGFLKKVYRWVLDALEEYTTGFADLILVNSEFTAGVFEQTFRRLHRKGIKPGVLYPATTIPSDEALNQALESWKTDLPQDLVEFLCQPKRITFLSINRFERKKNIHLAIEALEKLKQLKTDLTPQLVVAGGYDSRVQENVRVLEELRQLTEKHKLRGQVSFLPSFTDQQKSLLLAAAVAVVYTPSNEHFGIVPLESMAFKKAVVACNSGGPLESIVDGHTGYLVEPTAEAFAFCLAKLIPISEHTRLGKAAREHVKMKFSRTVFGEKLCEALFHLVK